MNTLNTIKAKMERQFSTEGIAAEVTFINDKMFSVLCDDGAQFVRMKQIMAAANQAFDSEDCDPECGYCAYYNF